jgi:hypothetical protein
MFCAATDTAKANPARPVTLTEAIEIGRATLRDNVAVAMMLLLFFWNSLQWIEC